MRKSRTPISTASIIILLLFVMYDGYPQISNIYGSGNEVLRVNKNKEVTGTGYLYPDWADGDIWDNTGKETKGVQLRYDTFNDWFETMVGGVKMIPDPGFIIKATLKIGGQQRTFRNGFTGIIGNTPKNYFEILLDTSTLKFLKKVKTTLIDEGTGYGNSERLTRLSTTEKFYLIMGNAPPVGVKLTKKSLVRDGGIDEKVVEDYLKGNTLKTEKDFTSFLKYYAAFLN